MSFEGSKAVLIKDLSGNILGVAGGSISATANVSGQLLGLTPASGFNAVYITDQSNTLIVDVTKADVDTLSTASVRQLWTNVANYAVDGTRLVRLKTTASGNVLSQGGTTFRLLTDTTRAGTTFRTRISGYLPVTDVSGGASVGSGTVVHGVTLRNISGSVNGIIWVGGSGTNLSPFSGHGYPLLTDDQITLPVSNFLQLRAVANISGVLLVATGVDF